MQYINGIPEVINPLLIVAPLILMILSGYSIGVIMSKVRKIDSTILRDVTNGSIVLNFFFISGFVIFGVVSYAAKTYFSIFTYILIILSIVGIFFLIKSVMPIFGENTSNVSKRTEILVLFAVALFLFVLSYQAIIIYYHPIYEEYDAIYNYLLTSKTILLEDGLHHTYYQGSDVAIRTPPMNNAMNAWIIEMFGYSSLRLFPVYFVILSSLYVYRFTQIVTRDQFLGLIAATAFMITPAMMIVSSRFSLSDDLGFIFFLTTSFYFLLEAVSQAKISKTSLLMLITSLSVLSLSRELGIIFSIAIFFSLLSVKFSNGRTILRTMFGILAFFPMYVLSFYDLHNYGIEPVLVIRLIAVVLANLGLLYILSQIKVQENFSVLIRNFKYMIPLAIPIIFLTINMFTIHGVYPIMTFSDNVNTSMTSFRDVFAVQNKILLDLPDALEKIPRIDLLFIASGMGSTFIFFKLRGFSIIIQGFKKNPHYAVLLMVFIFMITVWSYFDLGFESAQIRHMAYFIPFLSVVLALSMNKKTNHYKLFFYGMIVFSMYYFLFHNMQIIHYNGHFGGFWLDPYQNSTITLLDLEIAAVLILSLFVIELKEHAIIKMTKKNILKFGSSKYLSYTIIILVAMVGLQICIFSSTGISLESPEKINSIPQNGWEENISTVIDYLNHSDNGSVLSLHASALSFFTNRTNFELYDPFTFAKVSTLLKTSDPNLFKQKISELNIKYFVMPNPKSPSYGETQKVMKRFSGLNMIQNDSDFIKTSLKSYDIYKFDRSSGVNLIDKSYTWTTVEQAKTFYIDEIFNIRTKTQSTEMLYNRAVLEVNLTLASPSLFLIEYSTDTMQGIANFYAEIVDRNTGKIQWSNILDYTDRKMVTKTFQLPNEIGKNPVEVKLYVITEGPGEHVLSVKKARIIHT